ncbi:predicted protein [Naegleria gruberi]|uniref:Predicted protein n=1 Tax=Naegleria gruberi TaxID=5762 RepID=D2VKI5_NAEGR|nr:uncharacterized protein NAEGRDRAFT_69405 [Naegleria gruberi]EFC42600.1 predicted protein [Naegleria gruberi]|eukprot:XP_002675344.1 predicted protein [Naegleria gruberi strain NEG-M]
MQLARVADVNDRQVFKPCTLIDDQERVLRMYCGRSHVLYETRDGSLISFGRNDYGQCSIHEKEVNRPVPALYKTRTGAVQQVKYPKFFSTGWFHSLLVKDERLYACGYFSYSPMSGHVIFNDVTDIVIKVPFKEITFVGSGDHVCTIVVDNCRIIQMNTNLEVYNVDNLREICAYKSGFCYISTGGVIYQPEGNNIVQAKEYSSFGCYDLRTTAVGGFSFKSRKLEKSIIGTDEYSLDCNVYSSFCSHFVYNTKERKLYAYGSNSDHQLGVGTASAAKGSEVSSINQILSDNSNWDILDIHSGCDFTIISIGVPYSKNVIRFKNNLLKNANASLLTDVKFL